jgi:hypothetical protein
MFHPLNNSSSSNNNHNCNFRCLAMALDLAFLDLTD